MGRPRDIKHPRRKLLELFDVPARPGHYKKSIKLKIKERHLEAETKKEGEEKKQRKERSKRLQLKKPVASSWARFFFFSIFPLKSTK
ncbi:hypothetical protein CEXT_105791 [Caerostris extrusa]|uniref:Uncharacterized protein n=1 Tax=Caerostris extrusa TaxID=172846 RepID=A0AAV4P778_CAEEX|nr:hypothetical protein CEXT_105791 [Caerostris extrusa]